MVLGGFMPLGLMAKCLLNNQFQIDFHQWICFSGRGGKGWIYFSAIKVKSSSCSVMELFKFNSAPHKHSLEKLWPLTGCTFSLIKAAASPFSRHSETSWQVSNCFTTALEFQQSPWQQSNNHTSSQTSRQAEAFGNPAHTYSVTRWAGFSAAIHCHAAALRLASQHQ